MASKLIMLFELVSGMYSRPAGVSTILCARGLLEEGDRRLNNKETFPKLKGLCHEMDNFF
jgi:hypothetical protein